MKIITAGVSVLTAILLFPIIPKALSLRSPKELEKINEKLLQEIDLRRNTEEQLAHANDDLEERVARRTRELEQKTRELQQSNSELEQFAYVSSHDLQEPLRMISNYCQLIKVEGGKTVSEGDIAMYLDYAIEGAKRMKLLIDDVLEFSRLEKPGKELNQIVDCNKVVSEIIGVHQESIQRDGIVIKIGALPSISGEYSSIVRLFQNIIGNAIKYANPLVPLSIEVSARIAGNMVMFSIKDNGIGIEPEFFDRIFLIFQRLHSRNKYPGTGMGLAICKKIVESHQGQIWVESEVGTGSTFFFTLPLAGDRTVNE